MNRVLGLFVGCALLWGTAEASVTDIKWGVDAEKNLRLVVDLTEPADFVTSVENQTLVIKVKSALEGESRSVDVASEFAKSMSIKAAGAETVVRVPLTQVIAKENIKTFTLKQDPVTKRPSRIVFDILKKQAVPVIASTTTVKVEAPKINSEPVKAVEPEPAKAAEPTKVAAAETAEPKITESSGTAPSTQTAEPPKINPNINPKLIPASVLSSKGVQLADTKQIAKIPEIRRSSAAVTKSSGSAATPVKVRMTPAPQNSTSTAQSAAPKTTVSPATPSRTTVQAPKVTVGSSPSNKAELQAKATQRGKDAVADILERNKNTAVTAAPAKAVEQPAPEVPKVSVPSATVEKAAAVVAAPVLSSATPSAVEKKEKKKAKKTKGNKKGEYRASGGIQGKVITIDPGHGGSDPGAVSKKGTYEKTITLAMARKLKADLEKMGATVYLTRSGDVDVAGKNADDAAELQARVDVAEKHCSDLFISLHINASVNKKASGISTYYYAKSNYDGKLAKCIHKQLTTNFGLNDMGVREANFYVIKRCCMPAVLMELGFISNAKEEKTIKGNWFQNKAMDLVSKGIKDYFK